VSKKVFAPTKIPAKMWSEEVLKKGNSYIGTSEIISMKVNVAKSAGFCFGVRRALKIAFESVKSGDKIEMLGDIVHNEEVVQEITKAGIKKIKLLRNGRNKTLLIRAHGVPAKTIVKAQSFGYTIVDATCPMVKEIHKIAMEMERKDYTIIIIGDKEHDEVRGIVGQLKRKAVVIDIIENIPFKTIRKIKNAAVVVQSTQNMEKIILIIDVLKQYIRQLKIFNTICKPTRIKQEEIKTMSLENDVMIIIGSKTSANTGRLYEISKSLNKHSFWIRSEGEVKQEWFKGVKNVGITAGASTPDPTTKKIVQFVKSLGVRS